MYCVEWKTRNAKPARKSRDDNKPATGLNVNPVQSKEMKNYTVMYIPLYVINTRGARGRNQILIAYRGKSKNRLKFLCLPEFQSHHTLRLLLLRINYIQLQRKSNNFHGLTIKKTKRILGLKFGKIQVHIIMTCVWRIAIVFFFFFYNLTYFVIKDDKMVYLSKISKYLPTGELYRLYKYEFKINIYNFHFQMNSLKVKSFS